MDFLGRKKFPISNIFQPPSLDGCSNGLAKITMAIQAAIRSMAAYQKREIENLADYDKHCSISRKCQMNHEYKSVETNDQIPPCSLARLESLPPIISDPENWDPEKTMCTALHQGF